MFYSDNPLADFERYDAEQEKQLEQLPRCADCDHYIQQETAVYINGEYICDQCLDSYRTEVIMS